MQLANPYSNEDHMKIRLYILFFVLALWPPFLSTAASPESPPPFRNIDLIREMSEGNLAAYYRAGETAVSPQAAQSPDVTLPFTSRIAYDTFRHDRWDIYLHHVNGGLNDVPLVLSPAADAYVALRNGVDRLAFVSNRNGAQDIYRLDISSGALLNISQSSSADLNPSWSLDGARIAFDSLRTGNQEIFVSNSDGTSLQQLTHHPAYDGQPSWSPDGAQIVFTSFRTGRYELWVMNADGTNQWQLTFGANALFPAWSPDGTQIAYANDSDGDGWLELWLINADGTGARRHLMGAALRDFWMPAWSPDGSHIAFAWTAWDHHQGQFFWTSSRIMTTQAAVPDTYSTTSILDDRAFWPSWAAVDGTPPSPCAIQTNPWQHDPIFMLAWSATDAGGAGMGRYDVEARQSASNPWQPVAINTPRASTRFEFAQDGAFQFRCRAWDRAYNQGAWGQPTTISVDTRLPASSVRPLAPYTQEPVTVQWVGSGGGLTYDIYVREGTTGDWQAWQEAVSSTSATFTGAPGHTYYFRSQARDGRRLEPWQAQPDTAVAFYAGYISGFVKDNRGNPVAEPVIMATPAAFILEQDARSGAYKLFLGDFGDYTLNFDATGYKPLPATVVSLDGELTFQAILPPADDAVMNGGFEDETLDGWLVTGTAAAADDARHSGDYGLKISHTTMTETVAAQTINVGSHWVNPTLSFLYHIPAPLTGGSFQTQISQGNSTITVLDTAESTATWQHVWVDLTPYNGQTITITLAAAHAVGDIWIDELSAGSWTTPQITAVSPVAWRYQEPATLTITGSNFLATPAVYLDQLSLSNVTWLSGSQLQIDAPTTIPEGVYSLTVVNPGGAKVVAAPTITVAQDRSFLPLVTKAGDGPPPTADWLTLGYDAAHTGYNVGDPGASRYQFLWSKDLPFPGGAALDNIAVSNNLVVATSVIPNQIAAVVALDLGTGVERWRQEMVSNAFQPPGDSVSPPTIAHGVVYVTQNTQSTFGSSYVSFLHAFDLYNGLKLWSASLPVCCNNFEKYYQPVVADGRLFLGSGNIRGLDAFTGEILWLGAWGSPPWLPTYHNGSLYVANSYHFYRYPADSGDFTWTIDITEAPLTTLIAGNRAILSSETRLTAINLDTRTIAWSRDGNYGRNLAAVANNVLYSLNGTMLEARNPVNGALLWQYNTNDTLVNSPIVAGNYVYVASETQTFVINRSSQQLEWSTNKGGWLAVANGHLFMADKNKVVYAYRATEP
jgi:Tol biopolymer transport system component